MSGHQSDTGKLVLRLLIGVLLLLHGVHKIINGPSGIDGMVAAAGFPAFFGWAVYIGEVFAPALVICGLFSRIGGLLILINMICAVLLAFGLNAWALNANGGWAIELEALYGVGGLVIFLIGAGRFSIGGAQGKYN